MAYEALSKVIVYLSQHMRVHHHLIQSQLVMLPFKAAPGIPAQARMQIMYELKN